MALRQQDFGEVVDRVLALTGEGIIVGLEYVIKVKFQILSIDSVYQFIRFQTSIYHTEIRQAVASRCNVNTRFLRAQSRCVGLGLLGLFSYIYLAKVIDFKVALLINILV